MKHTLSGAAALLLGACTCRSATDERYMVVKVQDHAKETTCQVMSADEFKAIQEEIRIETKVFPKALAEAQKAWREDPDTARKPFPKASFAVRRATPMGTFPDREKADAKVAGFEEREQQAKEKDKEREDKKLREKQKAMGPEKYDEYVEREREKQTERDALTLKARDLLEQKLADLVAGAGAAGAEPEPDTAREPEAASADQDAQPEAAPKDEAAE